MCNNKFHVVEADNYVSRFYKLDDELLYFNRISHYDSFQSEFNAFGKCWSIAFGHIEKGILKTKRGGREISAEGSKGLIFPPASIIEWNINPGYLNWYGYFSFRNYPDSLPQEAVSFDWNGELPKDTEELFDMILSIRDFTDIGKEETVSAVAYKVKDYIAKNCNDELSIKEVADKFKYSHPVMTKQFKNCFGLSPVEFRNAARIFDSSANMLKQKLTVTSAATKSGFSDMSRFYRQFKRHMKARPCQYSPHEGEGDE